MINGLRIILGPVGIWKRPGCGALPLAPDLLSSPEMSSHFAVRVNDWVSRLEEEIGHDGSALPYTTTKYDKPCLLGACSQSLGFEKACQLAVAFHKATRGCSIGDVFALLGLDSEGVGVSCQCLMLAHRRDRPSVLTFAKLQPCGDTQMTDLETTSNLPWDPKLL